MTEDEVVAIIKQPRFLSHPVLYRVILNTVAPLKLRPCGMWRFINQIIIISYVTFSWEAASIPTVTCFDFRQISCTPCAEKEPTVFSTQL